MMWYSVYIQIFIAVVKQNCIRREIEVIVQWQSLHFIFEGKTHMSSSRNRNKFLKEDDKMIVNCVTTTSELCEHCHQTAGQLDDC